jgi:hypothetical protein
MAIFNHDDKMLLATLLERLSRLNEPRGRRAVIIELELNPDDFHPEDGDTHTFAVVFVHELDSQDHKKALQKMVTMLIPHLPSHAKDLVRLQSVLEMLPVDWEGTEGRPDALGAVIKASDKDSKVTGHDEGITPHP